MMWKIVLPVLVAVFAVGAGASLVGGISVIDNNDEGAMNALNYAVVKYNKATNDMYLSQVKDVVKVQRQLVAGLKYIITVNMARTVCRKNSADEVCPIHTDPKMARTSQCVFTVLSQPWRSEINVLNQEC